jgi:hypothetical protein
MRLDWRRRTVAALSAGSPSLGERTLRAGANSNRQSLRVHYEGDGPGGTAQSEAAPHHAGQTNGERLRRIVPWKVP